MPSSTPNRAGFTLIEIVVALVLISIMAGVIAPRVIGRVTQGEGAALTGNLNAVSAAINGYRADLERYPSQLAHLASPPPAGALDTCGYQVPSPGRWRGPYLDRQVPASGLRSGTSVIQNPFQASAALPNGFKTLTLTATGVDRDVADQVEAAFDGDANLVAGAVRWSASPGSPDRGDLLYLLPVRGC